jgi:hypothetical protein
MNHDQYEVARQFPEIVAALNERNELCLGKQWRMSIPVHDTDSDIVITRGFEVALNEIVRLRLEREHLKTRLKKAYAQDWRYTITLRNAPNWTKMKTANWIHHKRLSKALAWVRGQDYWYDFIFRKPEPPQPVRFFDDDARRALEELP